MLSIFPQLFAFEVFAPLLLRFALGAFFIAAGLARLSKTKRMEAESKLKEKLPRTASGFVWYTGVIELTLGVLFLIGFLTQIVGIVGIIYAVKMVVIQEMRSSFRALAQHDFFTYIFIFGSSAALVLLGAGVFAFDLPL